MTYDATERSVQDAAPIELYTFTAYGEDYRFCTAATDQIVQLRRYQSAQITRTAPQQSGEIARNNIQVRTRQDFPITTFFDGFPPSDVILLKIERIHRGLDQPPAPFWNGRVLSCRYERDEAIFHCENIHTSLRRPGLRRLYGRGCPYVLYGPECRVDIELFKQSITVDAVNGRSIEAAAFDVAEDGRWAGGVVIYDAGNGRVVQRGIIAHQGDTILVTHPIPELEAGATIVAAPGCKHMLDDCHNFFDNRRRYGGLAPYLAGKNPFGPNALF